MMNVPDKIFQLHSWLDINVYMFVKRNTENGIVKVSFQRIADEFGTTRGKVRHIIDKFYSENLLSRSTSAQLPRKVRSNPAQASIESQDVTNDFRSTSAQSPLKVGANPAQNNIENDGIKKRSHAFGEKLIPFVQQYGKLMIREFFTYWTEANENGQKMRFEKEKVFDISRRLARWYKNNCDKQNANTSKSDIGVVLHDSQNKDYNKGLW